MIDHFSDTVPWFVLSYMIDTVYVWRHQYQAIKHMYSNFILGTTL